MKLNLPGNSIHNRIWIIVVLFLISTVAAYLADTSMLRTSLLREKTIQTRQVVETAHAVLAHYSSQEQSGKLSKAEAQHNASEAIRAMRYGDNNYFWINDLGAPFPQMVMHPVQPELEGLLLDGATFNSALQISYGDSNEFIDVAGSKNIFHAFQEVANHSNQGLVRYLWHKQLPDGKISAEKSPKLSFVKKFDAWGWVIGSGIYIDDIDRIIAEQTRQVLMRATFASLLLLMVASAIAYGIRQIEFELKNAKIRMQTLIDATSESVLLLGKSGEIQAINFFGAQRFNKNPEELLGIDFFAILPPLLAQSRREASEQVLATGEPLVLRDDRNGTHFENTIYPVFNQKGETTSVAVYAKDVTEAHQTKAIDEIFRHLDSVLLKWQMDSTIVAQIFCDNILPVFNLAGAWIGKAECDGRITVVAKAEMPAQHFLDTADLPQHWNNHESGWPPVSAVIRSGYRQISHIDPSIAVQHAQAALAAGVQSAITLPLLLEKKTWGTLTLYSKNAPLLANSQQRLAGIASRLSVSLESALQQEWLALFNTALTGIEQAVFISDAEHRIIWTNPAFTRICGYSQQDVLEQTPALFQGDMKNTAQLSEIKEMTAGGNAFDGELMFLHQDGHVFPVHAIVTPLVDNDNKISHYISIVEDISRRRTMEMQVRHMAHYDALTDLPNRALFHDRLQQAIISARRNETFGALLFIDLDRFKAINDQYGHAMGDIVLIEVSHRLRGLVRESDTVARLGGDEFTVILQNLHSKQDALLIAEKMNTALMAPIELATTTATIGSSIGIAFFPENNNDPEALLSAADNAMYQAKQAGRNAIRCANEPLAAVDGSNA